MSAPLTPTWLHIDALAGWIVESAEIRAGITAGCPDPEVERRLGVIARHLRTTRDDALRIVLEHAVRVTPRGRPMTTTATRAALALEARARLEDAMRAEREAADAYHVAVRALYEEVGATEAARALGVIPARIYQIVNKAKARAS